MKKLRIKYIHVQICFVEIDFRANLRVKYGYYISGSYSIKGVVYLRGLEKSFFFSYFECRCYKEHAI